LDQAHHLSPERAIERYIGRSGIRWAGEGAQLHSSVIEDRAKRSGYIFTIAKDETIESVAVEWVVTVPRSTLAEHVALLAITRAKEGLAQAASTLRAIYVRPSDAEMKH
jgi:hypothetical protein